MACIQPSIKQKVKRLPTGPQKQQTLNQPIEASVRLLGASYRMAKMDWIPILVLPGMYTFYMTKYRCTYIHIYIPLPRSYTPILLSTRETVAGNVLEFLGHVGMSKGV